MPFFWISRPSAGRSLVTASRAYCFLADAFVDEAAAGYPTAFLLAFDEIAGDPASDSLLSFVEPQLDRCQVIAFRGTLRLEPRNAPHSSATSSGGRQQGLNGQRVMMVSSDKARFHDGSAHGGSFFRLNRHSLHIER